VNIVIQISKSQEAAAPVEKVWAIVSDFETENRPWTDLRDIKILSRSKDSLEREAKIRRGPLGEAKSIQRLVVDPAQHTTTLTMTKGPMLGTRNITLVRTGDNQTRIEVLWSFEMKGVPEFALGFVRDNIARATEKALARIVKESEGQ
jgi:carbon monoxide dehydrogenase subunit G